MCQHVIVGVSACYSGCVNMFVVGVSACYSGCVSMFVVGVSACYIVGGSACLRFLSCYSSCLFPVSSFHSTDLVVCSNYKVLPSSYWQEQPRPGYCVGCAWLYICSGHH